MFMVKRLLTKIGAGSLGAAGLAYFGYKYYNSDSVRYITPSKLLPSYDFIVIGAGTSGCVVGRRLCEDISRPSVLLIETGPPDKMGLFSTQSVLPFAFLNFNTDIDYQFKTTPQKNACFDMNNNQSKWIRGRVVGGSSVVNHCVWVRGSGRDYDSWENNHQCKGWSYDNIKHFWKKIESINTKDEIFSQLVKSKEFENSETTNGLNGALKISHGTPIADISKLYVKGCVELGYKENTNYNGNKNGDNSGVSFTEYTKKDGKRHSSFRSYIAPLFEKKQNNVCIGCFFLFVCIVGCVCWTGLN